jgi:hypothetical protein
VEGSANPFQTVKRAYCALSAENPLKSFQQIFSGLYFSGFSAFFSAFFQWIFSRFLIFSA